MAEVNAPEGKGAGDKRRSKMEKAPPSVRGNGHKGQRRALVAGINDYEGAINDLPSCIADAEAMHKLLTDKYQFDR